MAITKDTPNYTLEQIEDMDKAYPSILDPSKDICEIYFNMGQRAVIQRMKDIQAHHRKRAIGSKL